MKQNLKKDIAKDYSIRIINEQAELETIRDFWNRKQWHPEADMDFYINIVCSEESFIRPFVILLSNNEQPETLLIGKIHETPINWKIGYKTLHKSVTRSLEILYGGLLGDTSHSNCMVILNELIRCMKPAGVDTVLFNHIRMDSEMYRLVKRIPSFFFRDHLAYPNKHWKLVLPESFEKFLHALSKSRRRNLRYYSNRLKTKFGEKWTIKRYCEETDFDQIMVDTVKIASQTYQHGIGVGMFDDEKTRKMTKFALKQKCLRSYILYIENEPCAFWNGYDYKGTFFTQFTGYRPDYREYRIGTVLLMKIVEELCDDKDIDVIDFGLGDAEYKSGYCDQAWYESQVYLFAQTFRGLRINLMRSFTGSFQLMAKKVLTRLEIINWVKKKWRHSLEG